MMNDSMIGERNSTPFISTRSSMRKKVIVLLSTFASTVLKIKSEGTLRRKYRAKPKYTISFPTVGTLICKHFARATPMSHNLIVNNEPVSTESWRITVSFQLS